LIATIILVVAHGFSLIGFLLVLVNVTIHHHRRRPVGTVLSCLLNAIARRIDRFSALQSIPVAPHKRDTVRRCA
jgi:hypothetical protein